MTRLNLLLLLALLASCLVLVQTAHQARQLFNALDRARQQEALLDTDFKRLDAERQAQATHLRVEAVARDKLGMRTATPAVTLYVIDGSGDKVGDKVGDKASDTSSEKASDSVAGHLTHGQGAASEAGR